MKIVHVIPFFLPDTVAGTEIYCWSLCKYLQGQGMEVEVVIPGYGLTATAEYEYDGIRVVKYAEPTEQTRLHIAGLAAPAHTPRGGANRQPTRFPSSLTNPDNPWGFNFHPPVLVK